MSTHAATEDVFAGSEDDKADRVYLAQGGDWSDIASEQAERGDETIVVNMGPQHPSTHGVLRLLLEMDGETVTSIRPGIGFLHTGIEKNMEYKTWTQGVTYVTRMDYVAPLFNEAVYCLAVEKLLVATGTGGMEIGALTVMTVAFREREMILDFLEGLSGLRMNHAYIRPGGVANDLPEDGLSHLRTVIDWLKKHLPEYAIFCNENPIFIGRLSGVGVMDLTAATMMGMSGPPLRATGYDFDLRKTQPYCGYETYDFETVTWDSNDAYGRFRIRLQECWESLKIVEQCYERLERTQGQPVMVADTKIAWPAQLSVGADGQGNSNEHIKHIMGESMEALIHHFKIVTEGFKVPVGQVYQAIEGELACHVVSDGGTRPYRVHFRDPGFNHLQSIPAMCEGGMMSDVVVAIASLDPVLGGVDR